MIRVYFFMFVICSAADASAQATMQYENNNQVDYGPLVVRTVAGLVFDGSGASIPSANIGLFTEGTHSLVSQTTSNANGYFSIGQLAAGKYRLVIQSDGLCSANARIAVAGWPRGGLFKSRSFYVHMTVRGIDKCSDVTFERPPNPPLQPTAGKRGG
jgi:hypothetical protein